MEVGLNYLIGFMSINKSLFMVNIKTVKELVDGISRWLEKLCNIILFNNLKYFRGGGTYNDNGEKIGKWIDLSDEYEFSSEITYKGQYKEGKKIGKWGIYFTDGKTK